MFYFDQFNLACLYFRNIEDLTSQVNNLEIKVNDSELENEELRERLGMDPKEQLDIEDVRHKKKVKAEQAVALNRALNKEVCNVDLKQFPWYYKYNLYSAGSDVSPSKVASQFHVCCHCFVFHVILFINHLLQRAGGSIGTK